MGHSGANAPVSLALDSNPDPIRRVVWVESGPLPDGAGVAPELAPEVTELPLPDFDTLGRTASLDGLSDDRLEAFRVRAVPEPGGH